MYKFFFFFPKTIIKVWRKTSKILIFNLNDIFRYKYNNDYDLINLK